MILLRQVAMYRNGGLIERAQPEVRDVSTALDMTKGGAASLPKNRPIQRAGWLQDPADSFFPESQAERKASTSSGNSSL
jgi:hypothetical protein